MLGMCGQALLSVYCLHDMHTHTHTQAVWRSRVCAFARALFLAITTIPTATKCVCIWFPTKRSTMYVYDVQPEIYSAAFTQAHKQTMSQIDSASTMHLVHFKSLSLLYTIYVYEPTCFTYLVAFSQQLHLSLRRLHEQILHVSSSHAQTRLVTDAWILHCFCAHFRTNWTGWYT